MPTHSMTSAHPCPSMLFKLRPCIQKLCNVYYPPTLSLGWIGQIKSRALSLASARSAYWLALHPRSLTPIWSWMHKTNAHPKPMGYGWAWAWACIWVWVCPFSKNLCNDLPPTQTLKDSKAHLTSHLLCPQPRRSTLTRRGGCCARPTTSCRREEQTIVAEGRQNDVAEELQPQRAAVQDLRPHLQPRERNWKGRY
jgi:hypothetical protein